MKNKIIVPLYFTGVLITLIFPAVILSVCVSHLLAAGFSFTYLCCAICSVVVEVVFIFTLYLGYYVEKYAEDCEAYIEACAERDCKCENKSEGDGD